MRPGPPWIRALAPLMSVLIPFSGSGEEQARDPAILKLRQFGSGATDKDLPGPDSPRADVHAKVFPGADHVLRPSGTGDGPLSLSHSQMDAPIRPGLRLRCRSFDVERMSTLFLKGVDAIVPKITLTDVTEELSGITDEARPHPDDPIMYTDGSVSFRRNRRDCSLEMTGEAPGAAAA